MYPSAGKHFSIAWLQTIQNQILNNLGKKTPKWMRILPEWFSQLAQKYPTAFNNENLATYNL